jgi:hypothetical protein
MNLRETKEAVRKLGFSLSQHRGGLYLKRFGAAQSWTHPDVYLPSTLEQALLTAQALARNYPWLNMPPQRKDLKTNVK